VGRRLRDRLTIGIEAHVAGLQAGIGTIEHFERPEFLDRISVLRQQTFMLDHLYESLVITLTWVFRVSVLMVLLAGVDPALLNLPLFAVPVILVSFRAPQAQRQVEEAAAPRRRMAEHAFRLATGAAAGRDIRLAGLRDTLGPAHAAAWHAWYRPIGRARAATALRSAAAWSVFGAGYVLNLYYAVEVARVPAPAVVLMLSAGVQLSDYVSAAVGEIGFITGVFAHAARRLSWLEDYARAAAAPGAEPAPDRLVSGIEFEHVAFSYPGADAPTLTDVTLRLPAGAVVAVVGENGAGKSTLIKLLAKFYTVGTGRILVDGVPLEQISTDRWRERLTGAFQDFAQFEFPVRTVVGVGDLPRAEDEPAVAAAIESGGAAEFVAALPGGVLTQLGAHWPEGVALSHGQWQRIALARGAMREQPLLLILDEPTAALDAETEHALFERYATMSRRGAANGRVTVLVSHRFSTVRMADLIVVLAGGRVVEFGAHRELIDLNGLYAELYRIQEQSYQS
jgi:ATP-binding cassette subfamily B protein